MKKEKKVRTYQRRTKTGKLVTVKQHTAKYDAAEKAKEMLKKKGAGDELSAKKKAKPVSSAGELDFSQADFKAWYHWDQENDPKNPAALKVEKALKAKMGAKGYRKYFNDMSDSYSARGHLKAYKECQSCGDKGGPKTKVAEPKSAKTTETKKESKASEDFKVKDTTLRRIDRTIKKLENPGKMWGNPKQLEHAAKVRKEKLRDLKKAKQHLENGDRIKAGRILANLDGRGHSGFDKKEFFTKEEIKSYNDKAAKKEAKKVQAAYDAKVTQAREILAEHEKRKAKPTKTSAKSSKKPNKTASASSWMKESPIKLRQKGKDVVGEYSLKGGEPWKVQVRRDREGNFRIVASQGFTGNYRTFGLTTLKNLDKHLRQEISPRQRRTSRLGPDGEISYGSTTIRSKALDKERVK